jgi:hypothetical protein
MRLGVFAGLCDPWLRPKRKPFVYTIVYYKSDMETQQGQETASTKSSTGAQEKDLLLPFESEHIPEFYREYYKIQRNNFFASIQAFPAMWRYYLLLDKIWLREFEDLKPPGDSKLIFPLLLFINAHAKIRISIELGFSGCLSEARSILRDAIDESG